MTTLRDRVHVPQLWAAGIPRGTLLLFVISTSVFLAQSLAQQGWDAPWLLSPDHVNVRSVLTYAFFHADVLHWAANMLFLWVVAPRVERAIGAWSMLGFFFVGSLVAGLLHMAMVYIFMPVTTTQPLLGASGGIASLLGVYTVRFYSHRISRSSIPIAWALAAWLLSESVFGWREIQQGRGHIAHWAHVGGYLAGLSLAVLIGMQRTARREAALEGPSLQQQVQRLSAYLRDNPDDAASRLEYAQILVRIGDRDRATRAFCRAMDTWRQQGRRKESAEVFLAMRAAGLEPPNPAVEVTAARTLEDAGFLTEALEVYDRLTAGRGPEAENASLRAARLVESRGIPEEAARRYQAFLLMFPDSQWTGTAKRRLSTLTALLNP